jgi:glycosyltransferase involved in cell wall biosynthesis
MAETEPMRVLFVSDHLGYPSGVIHGATTYFLQVLPRLSRQGAVELTCCFLRDYHEAAQQLDRQGVTPMFLKRGKWDTRALFDLVRLIRARQIDLVHVAGEKGMLLGRLAAGLTGARVIVHFHDTDPPPPLLARVQRALAGWTDAAIGVSQDTCELARRRFSLDPRKVHRLPNALDLSTCQATDASTRDAVRAELSLPSDAPLIAMVGRFVPVKNHRTAIDAMDAVRHDVPEARLLLVGDGPDRARCEALVSKRNLNHAVHFLGQRSDVPRVFAAVDVLVMPSQREGMPYAAIEALASGVPIVAYETGGLPELVEHQQTGLLVPPGDQNALAGALARVLSDSALRQQLSEGARAKARCFDIDHHVMQLLSLYQRVLGRPVDGDGEQAPSHHNAARGATMYADAMGLLTAGLESWPAMSGWVS